MKTRFVVYDFTTNQTLDTQRLDREAQLVAAEAKRDYPRNEIDVVPVRSK